MIKQKFISLSLFVATLSLFASVFVTTPTYAASCETRFLTFPSWYRGLVNGECQVDVNEVSGNTQKDKLTNFMQILALNIVEILMQIVAYVCVAFIMVGGFKYITSSGSPDGNVQGRQTIQNALIGLIIAMMSIGIVNFIGGGKF